MGRRTHESIGRLLPGRKTIILSTQPGFHVPGAIVAETFEEALCQASAEPIAFVVGGASVYRAALPHADRLYWTQIEADFEGDTYFPEVNWSEWQCVQRLAEAGPGASPFSWHIDRFDRYPAKSTAQQLSGQLDRTENLRERDASSVNGTLRYFENLSRPANASTAHPVAPPPTVARHSPEDDPEEL